MPAVRPRRHYARRMQTTAASPTAGNLKSALVAGVIAFVIYTVIALATGTGFGAAVGVGLIFLVGTAIITLIISLIVKAVRRSKTPA